ncbi:MAG: T9SS type A sorting domain-containing protein [Candidatus Cloacimonetes bacterium]|nr:T9SS type A sorting domain-containing protein [Candidatus Cloacimonadota bacterium]
MPSLQVVYDNENIYLCYYDHSQLQFSVWDNSLQLESTNSILTDKICSKMVKIDEYLLMTRCEICNLGNFTYIDLYALDEQGNPADILETNPTVIIDNWWDVHIANLLVDEDNAYITWLDWRNNMSYEYGFETKPMGGNRVYAQKVALETNSEDENQVSALTQLQIYPNPFNPEITIKWQLAELCENSRLDVFNIKGQKVQEYTLNTKAGQVTWDGKDTSQQQCSSGVYLLRLHNGQDVQAAKILMLK